MRLEDVTDEHVETIFGVHVKGALNTVQKPLPLVNGGASIVLVTAATVTDAELVDAGAHDQEAGSSAARRGRDAPGRANELGARGRRRSRRPAQQRSG